MDMSNMNGLSGGDYSPISHTFFKHPAVVAESTMGFKEEKGESSDVNFKAVENPEDWR